MTENDMGPTPKALPNLATPPARGMRLEKSDEGVWLVFGAGKYPHDPPRPANTVEIWLWHQRQFLQRRRAAATTALADILRMTYDDDMPDPLADAIRAATARAGATTDAR